MFALMAILIVPKQQQQGEEDQRCQVGMPYNSVFNKLGVFALSAEGVSSLAEGITSIRTILLSDSPHCLLCNETPTSHEFQGWDKDGVYQFIKQGSCNTARELKMHAESILLLNHLH